jgi:hypothetical protein
MDPTTAYQLARYRMTELEGEAAAERLAAGARRTRSSAGGNGSARGRRWVGRLGMIATALWSLAARLRDTPRVAAAEPDVRCR